MEALTDRITEVNDLFYTAVLVGLLVLTGLVLTVRTRAVQLRHFGRMWRDATRSRRGADGGISSFQAFAIGMASRVGVGNITGVALALVLGGPGAVFWMWIVALIGMATAFAEATLAQLFKVRWPDRTYRGGPAYYLERGLGSRRWGVTFAVLLVVAMVVAMPMVQANAISETVRAGHGVPVWLVAVVVAALTAAVVLGGVRAVARVTEYLAPVMALAYLLVALVVVLGNLDAVPQFLADIVAGAFGLREGLAGTAGGVWAAMLNGARRGLFSNEAGMGTSPNAAATATVRHPVQQGFIQALGVFLDTIVVCTATAFIILATGAPLYRPGRTTPDEAGSLTAGAVTSQLGDWMAWPMSAIVFFLAFSSILGAFAYAEVNLHFLRRRPGGTKVIAGITTVSAGVGALLPLPLVFALMDSAMAVMTVVNLVGVLALSRWVVGALRDYEAGVRADPQQGAPAFVAVGNVHLPAELDGRVWR